MPSFCFINGVALGGGLEVALHCTYRTISVRGADGRLPRVLPRPGPRLGRRLPAAPPDRPGPRAEADHREPAHRRTRCSRGPEAFALGIADAMFEPADFLEESLRWAARVAGRASVDGRSGPRWPTRPPSGTPAVADARFLTDGKLHGAAPAPYRALDLVAAARTATRDEGFAAEDEALADLLLSDELRAGLYAFDLVQKRAKRPAGAPDRALARHGHQGRRRRRRADGRPDRAAVRPPAAGPGRDDRPRPGPGGLRRRLRARRDRQAAVPRPDLARRRQPAEGADQPGR